MANIRMPFLGFVAALLTLLVLRVEAADEALKLTYCSSQNTGGDQDASKNLLYDPPLELNIPPY